MLGKRVKFVIMATNKMIEVKTPKTIVPPKLEKAKIIKPKNKIKEVNTMLFPVCLIVLIIEPSIELFISSLLNLARKCIE